MKFKPLFFLAALCLFNACGGSPNQLAGSIKEMLDLSFDSVTAYITENTLVIEYRKAGANETYEKVAKITCPAASVALNENISDQVVIDRVTIDRSEFPAAQSIRLYFTAYGATPGSAVTGEVHALFDGGRDLTGKFDTKIE